MNKQLLFEFYREQYAQELERKNELTAVVQVRLVALMSAAAILLYMLKTFQLQHSYPLLLVIFVCTASLSVLVFVYISWSLYKAYWGESYIRLPSIVDMENYRVKLEESGILKEHPDAYLDYLIEELSECMSDNVRKNDRRYQVMNKIMKKLPWAIIPFLISGSIYLLVDLDASSARKPLAVEIVRQ